MNRDLSAPSRSFCHGLAISGNTVIAPDGIGACGLVGLDASTGKVLWRVAAVLGKEATPLAWSKEGRACVISANEQGIIAYIDAQDGKLLWTFDGARVNGYTPLLSGDYLITHFLKAEERAKRKQFDDPGAIYSAPGENYGQIACWKLTLKSPELIWNAPSEWGAPWSCAIGSASGASICFRGKYSYYVVETETGKQVARHHLPTPVRWDEGHMMAFPGMFVLNPDSQHGQTKLFFLPARSDGKVSAMWSPPHPHATTYQSAISPIFADGRLFLRGADAIYCYDLRRKSR